MSKFNKKIYAVIVFLSLIISTNVSSAFEVSVHLLNAMCLVESNNRCNVVGDNGKAVGVLQLHKEYVDEVNRICKILKINAKYSYEDRTNAYKSREMTKIYLQFWGKQYEKNTGNIATDEVLAKIHNGHTFWRKNDKVKQNVEKYWKKVNSKFKR